MERSASTWRLPAACALALAVALTLPAAVAASHHLAGGKVFYLDLRVNQCAAWPHHGKIMQVVPCSNGTHNLETYLVGHGGWGLKATPRHAVAFAAARAVCLSAFQRRFGHPIGAGYGWYAFWPDPGAEHAKYADRMICTLVRWPGAPAMGPGLHDR